MCLPYNFPDSFDFQKSRSMLNNVQTGKKSKDSLDVDIRAFCIIFVVDAYQTIPVSDMDRMTSVLKLFVHTLVKEEIRDCFVSKQHPKITKKQESLLKQHIDTLL